MKKEGANDQYGHDNEANAIKENTEITLHKILKKVNVPEIRKNEEISISYVLLESIGLLRFRRIIDSVLQGLHIGAFVAELYHRVSAFIWQLICNIMQLNYPLNFKFTYLF